MNKNNTITARNENLKFPRKVGTYPQHPLTHTNSKCGLANLLCVINFENFSFLTDKLITILENKYD